MVFKLGGRLLNMETRTLSPGAPETHRGLSRARLFGSVSSSSSASTAWMRSSSSASLIHVRARWAKRSLASADLRFSLGARN